MYKNTTFFPVFRGNKHSKLVKSERQGIFISTIFVTSVILYKVDIFSVSVQSLHQLTVTVFAHFYANQCLYMDCSPDIILGYES